MSDTPTKRGRGRPPAGEAKRKRLELALSPAERAQLTTAAACEGAELATWIRETALRRARRTVRS